MALVASGVGLPPDLAQTLSSFGTNAYNQIGTNYAKAKGQAANDQSIRGYSSPGGSYSNERLGTQQGLDVGNLESGLGAGFGNTAYNNALQERNFGQQKQLTDIIGAAAAPTTLEEILGGIGGGARAGLNILPFFPRGKRGDSGVPNLSGGGSAYDIMNPGPLDLGYGGF